MRMKRGVFQDRDEIAGRLVSIWRDAISIGFDMAVLLHKKELVRESAEYKRLKQYERSYVEGYARCFEIEVVDRQFLEYGSWVTMPDGEIQWFGVAERMQKSTAELERIFPELAEYGVHRYIYEHQVRERSGIYWIGNGNRGPGEKPFFIPDVTMGNTIARNTRRVIA